MQTAITVIPKQVESSVVPKPTKTEIIGALVQLRVRQMREDNEAAEKRKATLKKKIDAKILSLFRKNFKQLARVDNIGDVSSRWNQNSNPSEISGVCVKLENGRYGNNDFQIPPDIAAMVIEFRKIQTFRIDAAEIQKQIRDSLIQKASATDRIQTMLADPETNKSLMGILDKLTGKTPAIEAAK